LVVQEYGVAQPQKASDCRIREALTATSGNITVAAKLLGIAKNSLYKRLRALELQPAFFRMGGVTPDHLRTGDATRSRVTPPVTYDQKSETDTFPNGVREPSFPGVHTVSRAWEKTPRALALRGFRNFALREKHLQAISRARRKLAAALDVDLSDSDLMQRFIDDKLEEWVTERLRIEPKP
jgi:hypothetical protein